MMISTKISKALVSVQRNGFQSLGETSVQAVCSSNLRICRANLDE
uniref:Uncharacterized protein n=1 Tax=Arundo donax TaxID=35708 RepID=A0A0A8YRW4_ARUDO